MQTNFAGVYIRAFSTAWEFSNKAVASRRPGAKLQLQGQMVCRLGVVLLGPSNVKILGGEVEDLVERNSQVN